MTSLIDAFEMFFEIVPATSEELLLEVYKLRYQVYCIETNFEDSSNHPDRIEYDDFDKQAIHYLIRHKRSNTYAATTRLILPVADHLESLFPIELHCKIDNIAAFKENFTRNKLAEVSRFCVSKDFKRRNKELGTLTGISPDNHDYSDFERRTFPHITIALIACLIRASSEHSIEFWYAVMEPAFLRFLSSLGIHFIQIGPLIDYHGKRQPSIIKVSNLLDGVAVKNPTLWDFLTTRGKYVHSR